MPIVNVRITAEAIIEVDTSLSEDQDQYAELDTYLKGVPLEEATSKQLAVAMVRYDEEEDTLDEYDIEWKVTEVRVLD